ncbi:glutamine amidotransferase [Methylohalomonas lacus]|uniref:Glutamine amidotransferase n=1 Tax=Methylohalomonas lacus TaxID=398773 RepID=A0AAE3HIH8_9GAMM|nr:class II glutamine amidotransferase [Methylohalomonas lacus]MCS3902976.1 glutamine amidotransferase [Methylohalomonas lacus]
MCRLAAYAGPPLSLRQLLLAPPHSLYKQAYAPAEMVSAVLNADGYGFGWYDDEQRPRIYTHTLPIWSDGNLPDLADSLSARLWLANVRSATPGQSVNLANTQPFRAGPLMYLHNGFLQDFNSGLRTRFHEHLQADLSASLQGTTDSEYLFALVRQHLRHTPDLGRALSTALDELEDLLAGRQALLGIVMSDGDSLYAVRHGIGCAPPTMYVSDSDPDYAGGWLIASERLTEPRYWQTLTAGRVHRFSPGQPLAASA